jgi:hypothetical protein
MRRFINQTEAHRTAKELRELREKVQMQRASWTSAYPGGVNVGVVTLDKDWFWGACRMAQRIGCALVVKADEDGKFHFYAVKT